MTLFPFFEDIENKNILIVGGGKVACEKYDKLKMFTNRIKVVAQETQLSGDFVYKKSFEDSDLEDIDICIVATSDRELNRNIASLCNAKAIKVNVVDGKNTEKGEVISRQYHHGRCDVGSPWACGTAFDVLE